MDTEKISALYNFDTYHEVLEKKKQGQVHTKRACYYNEHKHYDQ